MRIIIAVAIFCSAIALQAEPGIEKVEEDFRELPMEARRLTGPLFWLHGDETKDRLEMYVEKVAEGGNGMFVAESRPHNDWLGEGWYRDLEICVEAAKKHNLQMIIFDDHWWPSQMMGGRVPPEYGSKLLDGSSIKISGPRAINESGYGDDNLISVVAGRLVENEAVDSASLVNLTGLIEDGVLKWNVPTGEWLIMKFTWRFKGKVGAQQKMISVDGADPKCVEWFINAVYQPHYDRFKKDFGKTIVGFFYDEPETQGDWGSDLPVLAAELKVDINKLMVAYKFKLVGENQVAARYSYLDLFAESWGRTMFGGMSKWCRDHGVISMGHFMEHDNCIFRRDMSGGNMMQLQKYSDMGGIDLVCRQLYPGQRRMAHYQMPKIASSISHTLGKTDDISFCEIYGGYNQNLTYPQMKWLADWHQVRGVNLLNPHSFNPRAPYDNDFPPYFYNGGFEPRWPLYRVWADYTSRLSLMLTGGRHVCPVAFLHIGQSMHTGKAVRPEVFTSALQDALFDCDWLLYDTWENDAIVKGGKIKLQKEEYSILVVPPAEIIPYETLAKAKDFFESGGVVVGYDFLPEKSATIDKTSADISALKAAVWGDAKPGLKACRTNRAGGRSYLLPGNVSPADVKKALVDDAGVHPSLEVVAGDTGNWLHVMHRVKSGRDIFLVCNQNHNGSTRKFKLRITADGYPECWDAMGNQITAIPFNRLGKNQVEVDLSLEPSESVLLVFQKKKRDLPVRIDNDSKPLRDSIVLVRDPTPPELIIPSAPPQKKKKDSSKAALEGCPWVWFPEEHPGPGSRYFRGQFVVPAGRKVKRASFIGTCDNAFTLYVNGKEAGKSNHEPEGWRSLTKVDLSGFLADGRNLLAVSALNMDDGPNPAGLIGRFAIDFENGESVTGNVDATWKVSGNQQAGWSSLSFDDNEWSAVKVLGEYGCEPWGDFIGQSVPSIRLTASPVVSDPFVGHCDLPADVDLNKVRVFLEADNIAPEAAACVTVNGRAAGGFIGKPFRLEVTKYLKAGKNVISITPFAPKSVRLVVYR